MDQLRLVMQQHKQKREARKLKSGPYATPGTASAAENLSSTAAGGTAAVSMGGAAAQYSAVSALVATPLQQAAAPVQAGKAAPASNITGNNNNSSSNTNANSNTSTAPATAAAAAATAAPPSEVSPNHIVEEVDTAA